MSTKAQQVEAQHIRDTIGDAIPSNLRAPLRAVIEGTEIPGTAADVINVGWEVVRRVEVKA